MKNNIAVLIAALFFAGTLPAHAGEISNKLLLSSAWCSFSYNQVSGYSYTMRVVFNANGTYSTGSRSEGYSSGDSGTMASQNDSQSGGKWKVVSGELYLSEGYGELAHIETILKRNSSGYPIIVADGVEYSQCR